MLIEQSCQNKDKKKYLVESISLLQGSIIDTES